jgi:hypothetical protein
MIILPSLPVVLTCSACLLALVVGTAFRITNFLGGMARFGFLPSNLARWLYGLNRAK